MKQQADPYGRGSYCIVVAIHGDQSREAEVLRKFRDRYMKGNIVGEKIIEAYYRFSPGFNRRFSGQSLTGRAASAAITSFSRTVESFLL